MATGAQSETIPGPDGVYTACYDNGGAVKLFPSGTPACPKGWNGPVTWSRTGPAGLDGKDGSDGTNGLDGKDGAPGADGLSAYQVWQNAGHVGTVDDFLASLKGAPGTRGAPGDPGADGASAYQVWLSQGNAGSEADFLASLRGPAGAPGGGAMGIPHVVSSFASATPNGMAFALAACPVGELLLSGGSDGLAGFRLHSARPFYDHPYAPGAWSYGVYGQNVMSYDASIGASAVCVPVTG